MLKDFDTWNKEKKLVDARLINRKLYFYAREIWWCSAGLNVGVEENGKNSNFERPFLIIKKFNSDMIWAVPLTSKEKIGPYHHKLQDPTIKSWAILSQLKTMSTKRLLKKIDVASPTDFQEVISKLRNLL